MERLLEIIAGPFGVVLIALLVAWLILMFLAPIFWFGAWRAARNSQLEIEKIRSILEQTTGKKGVIETSVPAPVSYDHPLAVRR